MTEDEMVGWHHQLNGHEFEQTLGNSEEQGSLVCCSLWSCRVGHDLVTEEQQNKHLRKLSGSQGKVFKPDWENQGRSHKRGKNTKF